MSARTDADGNRLAPRPVVIFAKDLHSAREFATTERLRGNEWVFPRDPEQIRYTPIAAVAILDDFEQNPRHDLLAPLADVLEEEAGPYVPTIATTKG